MQSKYCHDRPPASCVGFEAQALNFTIPFEEFRLEYAGDAGIRAFARSRCSSIPTYGYFLRTLGFCSPEDDRLSVFGADNWQNIDRVDSDRQRVRAANLQTGWFKVSLNIQVETDPNGQALYNIVLSDSQRQTLLPTVIDPLTVERLGAEDVIRVELPNGALPKELSAVLLDGTDIIGQLRFTRDSRGNWQRL